MDVEEAGNTTDEVSDAARDEEDDDTNTGSNSDLNDPVNNQEEENSTEAVETISDEDAINEAPVGDVAEDIAEGNADDIETVEDEDATNENETTATSDDTIGIRTGAEPKNKEKWILPKIRTKRKAAVRSRALIKRIAEAANQSSDQDDVENMRQDSDESTPFPSRDHSPIRNEEDQFWPSEDEYLEDHITDFSGGNPTFLGQLYDVSLGSPLLMALTPSSPSCASPQTLPTETTSSRLCTARPRGPLPLELEVGESSSTSLSTISHISMSPSRISDSEIKFPTRIFYSSRRKKSRIKLPQGQSTWSA